MTAKRKPDIVVEVRRELDGKVYSRIRNRAIVTDFDNLSVIKDDVRYVVIDRANRRPYDIETVIRRGQMLANCLGVEYVEDLTWPCSAAEGFKDCHCPRCAKIADDRAKAK